MLDQNKPRNTITRRELLKRAAVAAGGAVLAACAPTPTAIPTKAPAAPAAAATAVPKAPTAAAPAAGKMELVYWRSLEGAVATALETQAKEYSAKANVDMKVIYQGNYIQLRDKLLAAAAAKAMPDILLMGNAYWVPFARQNIMEALDDYIKGSNGVDLKDYFPFVDRGIVNSKYYQLPIPVSAPLFYFNTDMFEKAKLPIPTEKWTWDDHYDKIMPALTVKDGSKVTVYGHAYRTATWNQQQEIWAYGSQMSDENYKLYLDSPEMIQQWTRWQKASAGGQNHIPTQAEGGKIQMLANLTAATCWDSTGVLQTFEGLVKGKFKWSVLAAPYGPKGRFAAEGGGGIHIVAASSKEKKDAAWGFVKYTQTPEQAAFFAQSTGYLAFTGKSQALMTDYLQKNPLFKIAYDALACCGRKSEPYNDCGRAQSLVYEALDRLAVSTEDVPTVLKKLQVEATAVMKEEGYFKG